jgi:hypothetical protein
MRRGGRWDAIIPRTRLASLLVALECRHDVAGEQQQVLAQRRGHDLAVADRRDGAAHRIGKLPQHAGDRGLREAQRLGRARDGPQPHAGLEGQELGEEAVPEKTPQTHARHRHVLRGSWVESAKVSLAWGAGRR